MRGDRRGEVVPPLLRDLIITNPASAASRLQAVVARLSLNCPSPSSFFEKEADLGIQWISSFILTFVFYDHCSPAKPALWRIHPTSV